LVCSILSDIFLSSLSSCFCYRLLCMIYESIGYFEVCDHPAPSHSVKKRVFALDLRFARGKAQRHVVGISRCRCKCEAEEEGE
jgi:hypothetical protein